MTERPAGPASLNARLLLASFLILPAFLGASGVLLDRGFHAGQLRAQEQRMALQQLLLARSADWDGLRWQIDELDDVRFGMADSGLYALILDRAGRVTWQSPSALEAGIDVAVSEDLLPGTRLPGLGDTRFLPACFGGRFFCHFKGLAWGSAGPEFVSLIIETQADVRAERDRLQRQLLQLLVATGVLLVLAQLAIVRLGLRPLARITRDIERLERGEADRLDAPAPAELAPLTGAVNQLLRSERQRRERVRSTMDRLAHVLKSPLMLLRNSRADDPAFPELVDAQVGRMLEVIDAELTRARLDGRATVLLDRSIDVAPVLRRIVDAYRRLPRPRAEGELEVDCAGIDDAARFVGDPRDLQDLFGSLLENALKFARRRVAVSATVQEGVLLLAVEDDGDGLPAGQERRILERGARADSAASGHGVGLSIVVEIVSAYGGAIDAGRSTLGGARFEVRLPLAEDHR